MVMVVERFGLVRSLCIASPRQYYDLRVSDLPSGQGVGGGARTRNGKVPADFRLANLRYRKYSRHQHHNIAAMGVQRSSMYKRG
ncbi:hypothetical protein PoB_004887200 [Plakobranchus ocellatus]|uniref:Uncharacterized protein n=1 Tax=Plakobranchus ocellatus TaxID=259542 RepID=A0AAV4BTP3_9GAST|nr:hypothetical protein PoB_004887200 [Plakobranchus ocellatus]